jgi:hypothetical protein
MVSVANKPFKLSVIQLNVVILSVVILNVVILNVIMQSVMALFHSTCPRLGVGVSIPLSGRTRLG